MILKICASVLSIFLLASCQKEYETTEITGIITNAATGNPLSNVAVWVIAYDYPYGTSYSDTSFTNSKGEYDIKIKGKGIDELIFNASRLGFVLYKYKPVNNTQTVNNIQLQPLDSYISYKILNKSNTKESIWGSYWSPVLSHQWLSGVSEYIPVPFGKTYTETRQCNGDSYIYITWDYYEYNVLQAFPNLDSIYVTRGDTAFYTITMK